MRNTFYILNKYFPSFINYLQTSKSKFPVFVRSSRLFDRALDFPDPFPPAMEACSRIHIFSIALPILTAVATAGVFGLSAYIFYPIAIAAISVLMETILLVNAMVINTSTRGGVRTEYFTDKKEMGINLQRADNTTIKTRMDSVKAKKRKGYQPT